MCRQIVESNNPKAKRLPSANPRQSRHRSYPDDKSHSRDDLRRKESRGRLIVQEVGALLRLGLRRMPLVYGFALELRSLLHRMRIRCKRRYDVYGLDLGPFHQTSIDGHLEVNTRTRACTQDTENFADRHPWATILDLEMYRDAWLAGAAWAESNSDSCKRAPETGQSLAQDTSVEVSVALAPETKARMTAAIVATNESRNRVGRNRP